MNSISIDLITPAFNSGHLLVETVRSVFNARILGLRYAIWDGKGTDGSCEEAAHLWGGGLEIHKAEDSGQYDALKRGFERMSGDIMGWINAGDNLFPWTLKAVADIFKQFPAVKWVYGRPCAGSDGVVRQIGPVKPIPRDVVRLGLCTNDGIGFLAQEAMFWRRDIYEKVGGISDSYDLVADFDLWTRLAILADPVACSIPLAMFAQHGNNRSQVLKGKAETELSVWLKHLSQKDRIARARLLNKFQLVRNARVIGTFPAKALFRLFRLDQFKGQMIKWNSRNDSSFLELQRLSVEHIA